MTIRLAPKRPDEQRRLQHDWSGWLGDATIVSQTTTSDDLTVVSSAPDADGKGVVFTLADGTDGENAVVAQAIVTSAGEHETETFLVPIAAEEVITLAEAKEYLRVRHSDEDTKIQAMIPRARLWVEDHTGIALVRRQFVERLLPSRYGIIRLSKGPLVSVDSVDYLDGGVAATIVPTAYPPTGELIYAGGWPALAANEKFSVAYTAGELVQNVDERLRGAMLSLIAAEYDSARAYPDEAVKAATNCCAYLRQVVA